MSCSDGKRHLNRTNYGWLRRGLNMPLKEDNPTVWLVPFQGFASGIASK